MPYEPWLKLIIWIIEFILIFKCNMDVIEKMFVIKSEILLHEIMSHGDPDLYSLFAF